MNAVIAKIIYGFAIDLGCQPPSNSYLTKIDLNKKKTTSLKYLSELML